MSQKKLEEILSSYITDAQSSIIRACISAFRLLPQGFKKIKLNKNQFALKRLFRMLIRRLKQNIAALRC